jgi:hypothetical protein
MNPREARRQAFLALDGVERCKEECRDMRRLNPAADLVHDLAYAARVLRKTPGFAISTAITIALGIGAATAIFSVTDAVLLRPLPYRNPGRLVLAAAFGLTRLMTSMLVGVPATDPATFAAMTLLFFLIAAVASWVPARRAAALDPTAALRED